MSDADALEQPTTDVDVVRLAPAAHVMAADAAWSDDDVRDCIECRVVAPAGSYPRLAPAFVDDAEAEAECRQAVSRYFKVLRQSHAGSVALRLPDARVAGQGAVVTRSGTLITDSVVTFTAHGKVPDGFTGVGPSTYGLRRPTRRIDRPCLLAKRPWYRNFGHWLIDCASTVSIASQLGLAKDMPIVIGDYRSSPAMQTVVRETLDLLGCRAEVLTHPDDEVWRFAQLCYVTPVHVPPLFKLPEALRALRTGLLAAAPAVPPRRRLFLSRGDRALRGLLNENELLGLCVKRGFELVQPDHLPLAEQAALFREAAIVVGVKGAALTNTVFMSPGAAVVALSPSDFPDPFFWDIAGQLEIRYLEVFGPIATNRERGLNDFAVQAARLQAALAAAEAKA